MLKLKLMLVVAVSLFGTYLLGGLLYAQVNLFANGDFETGDLSGWTQFTTPLGTLAGPAYPKVVSFDTDGNGTPTMSAQFSVGHTKGGTKSWEGGGIYQSVDLAGGDYQFSANIAVADSGSKYGNGQGGKFELLVDGVVVDTIDFGLINANSVKRSLLAALPGLAQGPHEVRIRITRPVMPGSTLSQYLDNVVLSEIVPPQADPASTDPAKCNNGKGGGNKGNGNNNKGGKKGGTC